MSQRLTVVVSQGQSHNPAKRKLEEDIVAALLVERGIEVTVVPHLYDLTPDGTGMLCLQGISGNFVVLSWMFPRAAHWILNRNGIHGHVGTSLLMEPADAEDEEEHAEGNHAEDNEAENNEADDNEAEDETEEETKQRVIDTLDLPNRTIYCIDLRVSNQAAAYVEELRRMAEEFATQTVSLDSWIGGQPKPEQLNRYMNPTVGNVTHNDIGNGRTSEPGEHAQTADEPQVVHEATDRRWYPVIDFSRCTNCMECIDFCLFGVYGVDKVDTILVEQPDNCRKGCPACSRVCPENAIIFPQHKTPAIAGSPEVAESLKIDLSKLFGAPSVDAVDVAVLERDEQLLLAGREIVGDTVGVPRRQQDKATSERDDLDDLIDQLDELEL